MKGFLIVFILCFLEIYALPKPINKSQPIRGRVGNGEIAANAPHAAMVLVHRAELENSGTVALGAGSIISTRHVLTAAHLVRGTVTQYQVGFIVGTARRIVSSTFALIHEDFDASDFSADIALIFLQGTASFPLASVVGIPEPDAEPDSGTEYTVVGFGFTTPGSTGASTDPYAALQTLSDSCENDNFEAAETHFCATDESSETVVCPGDNGAGLFEGSEDNGNILVGIASRIVAGCATSTITGYTQVSLYITWIRTITGTRGIISNDPTINMAYQ